MNLTLLQNASGDYVPLLEAVEPYHRRYCATHGILYVPTFGRVIRGRHPNWDRFPLMIDLLARSAVVWLDADAVICRDVDLHVALCGVDDIGMVRHQGTSWKEWGFHYNAGMMAVQSTRAARDFLARVFTLGEVPNKWNWRTQGAIHTVIDETGFKVSTVPSMWNSTAKASDSENAVVKSWHGAGPKVALAQIKMVLPKLRI